QAASAFFLGSIQPLFLYRMEERLPGIVKGSLRLGGYQQAVNWSPVDRGSHSDLSFPFPFSWHVFSLASSRVEAGIGRRGRGTTPWHCKTKEVFGIGSRSSGSDGISGTPC